MPLVTDGWQPMHDSTLSWDMVKSILDRVTIGATHWAEVHDPAIIEGDCTLEEEVHVVAGCVSTQMHVTDWTKAQRKDLMLGVVLDWLEAQMMTDLKVLLQNTPPVRKANWS